MSTNAAEIAAQIQARCQENAASIGQALAQALDTAAEVAVGQLQTSGPAELPESLAGPGLWLAFTLGQQGAVAFLPASSGRVPEWCVKPDEQAGQRLAQLASELAAALLPESLELKQARAGHVDDFAAAVARAVPSDPLAVIPLDLTGGEKAGQLFCVYAVEHAERALDSESSNETSAEGQTSAEGETTEASPGDETPADQAAAGSGDTVPPQAAPRRRLNYADLEEGIQQLPPYARSLLKIRVPITVTLASTKIPVKQITELSPGSIIQFKKPCDSSLSLEIGDQRIAEGEAVKVGDKFGLWITSMVLPEERFWIIQGQGSATRVK